MTIQYIIFPGGGPIGIYIYGILKQLKKNNFWNYNNIKSVYCTSIGGIFGIITLLNLEESWIDDYIIKRPWNKIMDFTKTNYFDSLSEKGLFGNQVFKDLLEPLLNAKDLDINITLQEFYDYCKIIIYFYSTNINSNLLELQEISYKNYPNMKLYDAIYATCCIPFIFKPYFINNKCLIDGGLMCNTPIDRCLVNEECDKNNILFFSNANENKKVELTNESNIFDLLILLLSKLATTLMCTNINFKNIDNIKYTIKCNLNNGSFNLNYWYNVLNNENERKILINNGIDKANEFLKLINTTDIDNSINIDNTTDIHNNANDISNN